MSSVFCCQAFSGCSSWAFTWLLPGHVAQSLRRLPKQVKHAHTLSLEGCGVDTGVTHYLSCRENRMLWASLCPIWEWTGCETCTCRQRTMSFLYLGSSNQCFEAVTHPVQACHAVGFWGFYLSLCDTCMTTALNVVWRHKSEYSQRGEVEQEQEGKRTEEECGVKKWYSCLFSHSCCSSSHTHLHTHRDNETLFCDRQIERKKTKR